MIPNSVDVSSTLPSPRDDRYVAYSGRISREKGVDMIIETARRHPDISFRLAGAVRDTDLVENLPSNVELTGYLSGRSLQDFYAGASFFVMASRWYEGFPMTILEAASYAKPMIAPDHGGFTEIIGRGDDAVGILTRPSDVETLDNAITSLWNNPSEARRLGLAAYDKLKARYSTQVVATKWDNQLRTITSK